MYYELSIKPNYSVHSKSSVHKYIDEMMVERLQIEEKLDYSIISRKPTNLILV
jgi:hypothetical protein